MHNLIFRFEFKGSIEDSNIILFKNWSYYTRGKSAKQALTHINFAAKKKCDLKEDMKLFLNGTLTCEDIISYNIVDGNIIYPENEDINTYTVETSKGLRLNKNANLPYYADLFYFFKDSTYFSREQFIWKLEDLKIEKPFLHKISNETNQQLSFFDFERVNDDILKDEEDVNWIWDEEEGVYWKNGEKFGEYLTSLNDN